MESIRLKVNEQEAIFLQTQDSQQRLSYWKDIELTNDNFQTVNNIVEVPRGTFAKFQMNTKAEFHPIMQDIRKINEKKVHRYFQMALLFNYGYLPQTWEGDITDKPMNNGFIGDNDPLDTVEISGRKISGFLPTECVVLGALGLVDQDEMDWKIILLNREDAEKTKTKSLEEAQKNYGPLLEYIRGFFAEYKTQEGKKRNSYLENGKFLDEKVALEIIKANNQDFRLMVDDKKYENRAKSFYLI